jgi:hypothetical protein
VWHGAGGDAAHKKGKRNGTDASAQIAALLTSVDYARNYDPVMAVIIEAIDEAWARPSTTPTSAPAACRLGRGKNSRKTAMILFLSRGTGL